MIVCENVYKSFEKGEEEREILQGLFLHVKKGECVVLKGASGSGKSTLLSLIAGLMPPTSGKIVVDGKEISKIPDSFSAPMRRNTIGFMFQKYYLLEHLSVIENVMLPLLPENLPRSLLQERAKNVLERYELSSKASYSISKLSGGEQQRVAIVRALISQPRIILADEPTAHLDERLSFSLIKEFERLKSEGMTLVIATHDPLFFDLSFVDRVVVLKHGAIIS